MCGIAGVSFAGATQLDTDKLADIISSGIRENIHRGTDASGFFICHSGKKPIAYSKRPGHPNKMLKKLDKALQHLHIDNPIYSIVTHTRAASKATPQDNSNNHPVVCGTWVAVHNGFIANKEALVGVLNVPAVDSFAIPHVLQDVDNLLDPKQLEAFTHLDGRYVFVAASAENPHLTLLVAGDAYPLNIWHSADVGTIYASEPSGVKKIGETLGVDIDPSRITLLKEGRFIVLDHGIPKVFGTFRKKAPNKRKFVRVDHQGNEAWQSSSINFVHLKDGDALSILDAPKFDEIKGERLAKLPDDVKRAALEADFVYVIPNKFKLYSVWYGNVEIIVSRMGTVIDVIDWDKGQNKRHVFEEENQNTNLISVAESPFDKWLAENKRVVNTALPVVGALRDTNAKPWQGQLQEKRTKAVEDAKFALTRANFLLSFESALSIEKPHVVTAVTSDNEKIKILCKAKDSICSVHAFPYSKHKFLSSCPDALGRFAAWLSQQELAFQDIYSISSTHTKIHVVEKGGCKDKPHDVKIVGDIVLDIDGTDIFIPHLEACVDCDFAVEITRFPYVVEALIDKFEVKDAAAIRN